MRLNLTIPQSQQYIPIDIDNPKASPEALAKTLSEALGTKLSTVHVKALHAKLVEATTDTLTVRFDSVLPFINPQSLPGLEKGLPQSHVNALQAPGSAPLTTAPNAPTDLEGGLSELEGEPGNTAELGGTHEDIVHNVQAPTTQGGAPLQELSIVERQVFLQDLASSLKDLGDAIGRKVGIQDSEERRMAMMGVKDKARSHQRETMKQRVVAERRAAETTNNVQPDNAQPDNVQPNNVQPQRVGLELRQELAEHLTLDQLLQVFAEFDYSWQTAKLETRGESTKTRPIVALEQAIGYAFEPEEVGPAKMWLINGLREKYAWHPVQELAVQKFAERLQGELGTQYQVNTQQTGDGEFNITYTGPLNGEPQVHQIQIQYLAKGSTDRDSDIDCPVRILPDQTNFSRFYNCAKEAIAENCRALADATANHAKQFSATSSEIPWDFNIYDPGAGIADGGIGSPFHPITQAGIKLKGQINMATAAIRLAEQGGDFFAQLTADLFTEPRVFSGQRLANALQPGSTGRTPTPAAEAAREAMQKADDYAVNRQLQTTTMLAHNLLALAEERQAHIPLTQLREILADTPQPNALRELTEGGKPLSPQQRSERIHKLHRLTHALAALDANSPTVGGERLFDAARERTLLHFVELKEAASLQRSSVLADMVDREQGLRLGTPGDALEEMRTMADRADRLMGEVLDHQAAIDWLQPEAYHSDASLKRVVAAQQVGIPQIENDLMSATAVASDVGFLAEHRTADFLPAEDANNPEMQRLAFGKHLLAVAKYVDRVMVEAENVDVSLWAKIGTTNGFRVGDRALSGEELIRLGDELAVAKKAKDVDQALAVADRYGITSDSDLEQLCKDVLRYARATFLSHEIERAHQHRAHQEVMQQIHTSVPA